MAKKASYLQNELIEVDEKKKYSASLERYTKVKKINSAKDVELFNMVCEGWKVSEYLYQANNLKTWEEIERAVVTLNHKPVYARIMRHVLSESQTFITFESFVKAIPNIIQMTENFIRPVEEWKAKRNNPKLQLHSLLSHLFCKYESPLFLTNGFVEGKMESMLLFVHIGQGKSVKSFELLPKMELNKKAYHYLFSTPEEYTYYQGFRRAQILSMGGNQRLFNACMDSKLKERDTRFIKEDLIAHLLDVFIKAEMFDYNKINEIVDYVDNRVRNQNPLAPFKIKGQGIGTLLKKSDEWHEEVVKAQRAQAIAARNAAPAGARGRGYSYQPAPASWNGFNIRNFSFDRPRKDQGKNYYSITQLCSSKQLSEEGFEMRNCVGSYAYSCSQGTKTIFSLREKESSKLGWKSLATIEVSKSFEVVQIRAKANQRADASIMNIIKMWIDNENLKLSSFA